MTSTIAELQAELEQYKKELAASEERFYNIIEKNADGIVVIDEEGYIRYANPAAVALLTRDAVEVVGTQFGFPVTGDATTELDILQGGGAKAVAEMHVAPSHWKGEKVFLATLRDVTNRKQREADIEFRTQLLHAVQQAVIATDVHGRVTYWNRFAEKLYGWPAQEVLGKNINDIIPTQSDGSDRKVITNSGGDDVWSGEFVAQDREGNKFPVMAFDSPIYGPNGALTGFVGISADLSQQKETEDALAESRSRFQAIWEVAVDAMALSDETGTVIEANPAYLNLYGLEKEETIGQDFSVIFPDEMRDFAREQYQKTFHNTEAPPVFESQVVRKEGENRIVESRVGFLKKNGRRQAMLSIIRDVTERTLAEQERRESEEKLRQVIEQSTDGIMLTDEKAHIVAWNSALEELTGLSKSFVLGRPLAEIQYTLAPDKVKERSNLYKEVQQRIDDFLEGKETAWLNSILTQRIQRQRDGKIRYMQVSIFDIDTSYGRILGSIMRDITREQVIENTLYFISQLNWDHDHNAFFDPLLKHLTTTLNVAYAFIGELTAGPDGRHDHIRTVSFYNNGEIDENITYTLKNTPCEEVLTENIIYYPDNIQERFPDDPLLADVNAQSYAGVTLWSSQEKPEGILAIIDTKPLQESQGMIESLLQLVGVRAAHELERKQADRRLRQLSQAVEQSPVSIVLTDTNGSIEYVNPRFTQVTGYTLEEVIGQNPRILSSGKQPSETYNEMWQTISSGGEWHGEFLNQKKDGELFWERASLSAITDKENNITHYLAVKENITEHKQMEAQLRQHNLELSLLNEAGQAINSSLELDEVLQILLDKTRQLLGVSACVVWLLNPEGDTLFCRKVTDPPGDSMLGLELSIEEGVTGWSVRHNQSLMIADAGADERYVPLDAHAGFTLHSLLVAPLRINQQVIGVFELMDEAVDRFTQHELYLAESLATVAVNAIENANLHHDLQEQLNKLKFAQSRLLQSEKLAAIGELVAGIAHELNNPLAAVILYSQLLQRKGAKPEVKRDLDRIVTQARRASNIVHGLLDFARQRPPEQKATQINDVLTSTLELLSYELRSHYIEMDLSIAPDLPLSMADPHQLQQVFVNLINNAIQAMYEKQGNGRLHITTYYGPSHYPEPANPSHQYIHITFQDNGPGIPPEIQTRIFDPFFTTKETGKGTGLGLSVCHGIVSEHNGNIWVETNDQAGALFHIELPHVTEKQAEPAPAIPDNQAAASNATPRILVIDDEESILRAVTQALHEQAYQVDSVKDAHEGLRLVHENNYDLILCDMRMPRMDGAEFFQQLQKTNPAMVDRLVIATGDTMNNSTRHFLEKNGVPALSKPFELAALIEQVRAILEKPA